MAKRSSEKSREENIKEMHESFCIYNAMDYSIDEYYLDLIQVLFKVNAKLTEFLNTHTNILTINYLLKNYLLSQLVVELYW